MSDEKTRTLERERLTQAVTLALKGTVMSGHEPIDEPKKQRDGSQATCLVQIGKTADLWHTPEDGTYATVTIGASRQNWALKSKQFRRWLQHQYFLTHKKAAGGQAVQDATAALEGHALFSGPCHPVFVRLASRDDKIYIDLANDAREAVEISASGWRVTTEHPIKFQRPNGMLPLPVPRPGGSLMELKNLLNIDPHRPDDWLLICAWLIGSVHPKGPYPILAVSGEQGSAKSTLVRIVRDLIDPNKCALRPEPRNPHDLMIAASNSWGLAFDNLSQIPPWLSDSLCRLTTGSAFGTRELYSDSDETLFAATRPILLNGIEELTTRPDLLDRAIPINLPTIPESARKTDASLQQQFEAAQPAILGALYDALAVGLRDCSKVKLDSLPRMADFARWVTACETGLGWPSGTFIRAYSGNRAQANDLALEGSLVADAIKKLVDRRGEWEGSPTELLKELGEEAGDSAVKQKTWPKSPQHLSGHLKRVAPNLRAAGILVESSRNSHSRTIKLGMARDSSSLASSSSQSAVEAAIGADTSLHASTTGDTGIQSMTQPRAGDDDVTMRNDSNDAHDDEKQDFPNMPFWVRPFAARSK